MSLRLGGAADLKRAQGHQVNSSDSRPPTVNVLDSGVLPPKAQIMLELKTRVEELKMENEYQLRLKDMNYSEKIKELTDKFLQEMESLKTKNQVCLRETQPTTTNNKTFSIYSRWNWRRLSKLRSEGEPYDSVWFFSRAANIRNASSKVPGGIKQNL